MLERIGEGSDGLATVFPAMLNSLIALRALGYSKKHPVYEKAEKDFAGLFVDDPEDFRIQPCLSPVGTRRSTSSRSPNPGSAGTSRLAESGRLAASTRKCEFAAIGR